jgi:hypothetical protein
VKNRFLPISINILSIVCLLAAFYCPFMYCEFAAPFPDWLPDIMARSMQNWFIEKGGTPTSPPHLLKIIRNPLLSQEFFIGIALFSVDLSIIKIVLSFAKSKIEFIHSFRNVAIP